MVTFVIPTCNPGTVEKSFMDAFQHYETKALLIERKEDKLG